MYNNGKEKQNGTAHKQKQNGKIELFAMSHTEKKINMNKEQYKLFTDTLNYWKEQAHKYYLLSLDKTDNMNAEYINKYQTAKKNVEKLENGKYDIINCHEYGYKLQLD